MLRDGLVLTFLLDLSAHGQSHFVFYLKWTRVRGYLQIYTSHLLHYFWLSNKSCVSFQIHPLVLLRTLLYVVLVSSSSLPNCTWVELSVTIQPPKYQHKTFVQPLQLQQLSQLPLRQCRCSLSFLNVAKKPLKCPGFHTQLRDRYEHVMHHPGSHSALNFAINDCVNAQNSRFRCASSTTNVYLYINTFNIYVSPSEHYVRIVELSHSHTGTHTEI